jgi:hypothetical protein
VNQAEAKEIIANHLRELKKLPYAEFRSWVIEKTIETPLVKGSSGTEYQVEIQALWDGKRGGTIRVFVSVDDGGLLSSFLPLCGSFVVSPDASLEGRR